MSALTTLTTRLAAKLEMGDGADLIETLKATAFRTKPDGPKVGDAQMTALLVIANQYGLNPWTKEIYAFPDKNNGIVPVVGVDGWARIINNHPAFDGMEFEQDDAGCTCIMFRKDRSHPVKIREYMVECNRPGVGPWQSHPWRMLRHKAMIQCARIAFGFGGIYDQDEAERIAENEPKFMGAAEVVQPTAPPSWPADLFAQRLPEWRKAIAAGKATADAIIAKARTKHPLTPDQEADIRAQDVVTDAAPKVTYAQVDAGMRAARTVEALGEAAALIAAVADEQQREELTRTFEQLDEEMTGGMAQ